MTRKVVDLLNTNNPETLKAKVSTLSDTEKEAIICGFITAIQENEDARRLIMSLAELS